MNVNWKDLARIDGLLTRRFVDSEKNNSHKIAVEVTPDMPTRPELEKSELYQKVEKSYEMLKNIVDIKPLWGNYSRDGGFVSYGVFAKNLLPAGCRITFLSGFLAPISVADITDGENDFSIFDLSSAEKLLVLGPASFINSSCRNNSFYDPQQKESLLYIKVGEKSILPGQEITVLYSGGYFGPNRINCQCPHVEFHGADPYVFATRTRSGKVFAENDCNSDASHEERVEEIENNIIEPPAEEQDADNESSEIEISPPIPGTERTELNSESPQIPFKSQLENNRRKRRVTKPTFIPYRRRKKIEVFALPEVPSATSAHSSDSETHKCNDDCSMSELPDSEFLAPLHSTPQKDVLIWDQICSSDSDDDAPTLHESPDSSSGSSTQDEGYEEEKSFENSLLSLNDYRSQLLQIATQHSLSDRALKSVHCLVAQCMPASNNLPSFNSIQTYQSNLLNSVSKTVCSNGVCLTLNIKPLLSKVIEENLHILDQSKNWIPEKVLKLPSVSNDSVKTIYLIINTEGISPSKY